MTGVFVRGTRPKSVGLTADMLRLCGCMALQLATLYNPPAQLSLMLPKLIRIVLGDPRGGTWSTSKEDAELSCWLLSVALIG